MDQPIWQIKKEMCDIGHRIWQKGFCAGNEGNHSVRVGENRVLCTPTGISKGFLDPDDIIVVDLEGKQAEPNARGRKPTSEIKVHLALYKLRANVKAVIHSHPPHATAFAVAGIPLPEGIHPEAEVFLGRVPTAPYATPSTQALPDSITALVGPETNTVLMGNHGAVCFGATLVDTYYKLEILDAYCRILILTKQIGKANALSTDEMVELLEVKKKFGLTDSRLSCAPKGCVGEMNQDFFATFESVRPMTATCECQHGEMEHATEAEKAEDAVGQGGGTGGGVASDAAFEAMVQTITNQIMAAAGR